MRRNWLQMLLLIAGLASFARAADSDLYKPDPSLVQIWSKELARREPFQAPFFAHFHQGAKDLYYMAAEHGNNDAAPTFQLIRKLIEKRPCQVSVLEGFSSDSDVSSSELLVDFRKGNDGHFYKWGEFSYTALLSSERGIKFIGAEPTERAVIQAIKKAGYTMEDLQAYYFLRYTRQMIEDGDLKAKGIEKSFADYIAAKASWFDLRPGEILTYRHFLSWYKEKIGSDFDLAVSGDSAVPLADGNYAQRLSAFDGMVRDRAILEKIAEALNANDRVLVVYGASHLATQRKALEAMLGKPLEQATVLQ